MKLMAQRSWQQGEPLALVEMPTPEPRAGARRDLPWDGSTPPRMLVGSASSGLVAPAMSRNQFGDAIDSLLDRLNAMQLTTERLEKAWKQLIARDVEEAVTQFGDRWWTHAGTGGDPPCATVTNERLRAVMLAFARTFSRAVEAAQSGSLACTGTTRISPCLVRRSVMTISMFETWTST